MRYVNTGTEPSDEQPPLQETCSYMGQLGWELTGVARSSTGKFYHLFFKRAVYDTPNESEEP